MAPPISVRVADMDDTLLKLPLSGETRVELEHDDEESKDEEHEREEEVRDSVLLVAREIEAGVEGEITLAIVIEKKKLIISEDE
ncbi:hypothetical protein BGW42_005022 [Actinomortierella wolfii]|nr:hypothetical protein BGW42_005022 [Actinomortierella wolfii]